MSFSNEFETRVLTWALTDGTATRPTAWFVGLHTSSPADDDSGTEVTGGSYARTAATFSVVGDTADNDSAVEFPIATASWGTVSHFGVYDASTAGNLIGHGALTTSKAVASGDTMRFAAGDLDVTLD